MRTKRVHPHRLTAFQKFGSNPGNLKAYTYVPKNNRPTLPLVVVLHGCTQNAEDFDRGAGWSRLADQLGFALLYPEQQRDNNQNLCFNWFEREDVKRDGGEVLSIRQMIGAFGEIQRIDPNRIFITGLSAGGAMTMAMLATYPEIFAGGAVIGGLPYGIAQNVAGAFELMQGKKTHSAQELDLLVRTASTHGGQWPALSVWHGTHDHTVKPRNADQIIKQWSVISGVTSAPDVRIINGHKRTRWTNNAGRHVLEHIEIKGMAHGVPLSTKGTDALGEAGPFMLEAGISSTREIARFWQLDDQATASDDQPIDFGESAGVLDGEILLPNAIGVVPAAENADTRNPEGFIQKTINDALRAAGLLR